MSAGANVNVDATAVIVLVGVVVAGVVLWKAKGALADGVGYLADLPGRAITAAGDAVQAGASALGVNYATELTPINNPYGTYMTPEQQTVADTYRPFGGFFDRLFNTDYAANQARAQYAATDPRRVDL